MYVSPSVFFDELVGSCLILNPLERKSIFCVPIFPEFSLSFKLAARVVSAGLEVSRTESLISQFVYELVKDSDLIQTSAGRKPNSTKIPSADPISYV